MDSILQKLAKRKIFRTMVIYLGSSWVIIEASDRFIERYQWPTFIGDSILTFLIFGLLSALIYMWKHGGVRVIKLNAGEVIFHSLNLGIAGMVIFFLIKEGDRSDVIGNSINNNNLNEKSIAVLALDNLSGDPEQEYFVAGMHDALITELSKISALLVKSRTSTLQFRDSNMSISEIAQKLGVYNIIEGSVFKAGDSVRIQVQLIEVFPVERHLWANSYDRKIQNVLAMHGEVTREIARQIEVKLTPQEEALIDTTRKVNSEAYEAYLKGNFYLNKATKHDLETSLQYFELAKEIDPDYALAYTGIALVWGFRMQMGYASFNEASPKAKSAAWKAMKLDSTHADIHYMLAVSSAWGEWNWDEAVKEFKQAISLNPNHAEARAYYSHILYTLGHPEEARKQIVLAMKLDPFNSLLKNLYGMDLVYEHLYDSAIHVLHMVLNISPNDPIALSTLRTVYHQKQMYGKALEMWKTSYSSRGDSLAVKTLDQGYVEGGYHVALQRLAEYLIERSQVTHVTPWQIGTLYTRGGMKDLALDWLEKAYLTHDPNMPYIRIDPIFDYMHDDPRFLELLKKMNLDKY